MLFEYAKQVRRFLKDPRMQHIDEPDIWSYVNRARREVALRSQSIRRVPPIAGSILEIQVLNPGSGYTNPNVVISTPDSPSGALPNAGGGQARATAQQIAGQISNVSVVYGGDGYFQPSAAITDPTGTGVQLQVITTPINVTQIFQESYNFSDFPVSQFPGVKSVFAVIETSVIYANYRYSLPYYAFSVYQSMIRQYPRQYYYVPTMHTQFGQGTNGNLLMYPIASQQYQFEVDCLCLPVDLVSDNDYEALPEPWTDSVPYFAASLCYEEIQNLNAAAYYQKKYDDFVHKYSAYARPGRINNVYGRY
jgi:hypothetical protein